MATLKDTVNSMVQQLNTFASEVTRAALEVGMEGKLGGQAVVVGVEGMWETLTGQCQHDGALPVFLEWTTVDALTI